MVRILGLSGSLRKGSFNSALLRAAAGLMPESATLEIGTIEGIPLYHGDLEAERGLPEAVIALKDQVAQADALLLVTPEYNNSIPGVFKNAIDWLSRVPGAPFQGKPVAIASASMGGMGGARAQYHLRQVLIYLDVHPLNKPELFISAAHEKFDADGTLTDAASRDGLDQLLAALAAHARRLGTREAVAEAA